MRVTGQVMKDVFGSSERSLGVDHPVLTKERPQKSMEGFLPGEWFQASRKQQFPLAESELETGDKLAAKYAAQHFYRQEERITWVNPALVIGRETTGRDDSMDVRMNLQILPPGMQHTQEADLGAEMLRIGSNLLECGGAGAKQEIVDDLLVLQSEP